MSLTKFLLRVRRSFFVRRAEDEDLFVGWIKKRGAIRKVPLRPLGRLSYVRSWSTAWASSDTLSATELEGAMVSAESVQEDVELPRGARHLGIARDRPPPR